MADIEPLEPHLKITLVATLGTLSDYATTQIALKYPELKEANPRVNFLNEFTFTEIGGISLYTLAKLFKQSTDLSLFLGLVPATVPFGAALSNLVFIARAHSKYYPWKECPLLYPE